LEEYIEIPSDQGISFNVKPEMKAIAIAEKACEALHSGKWDQVIPLFTKPILVISQSVFFAV
jgi:bisphosphoglycerate-independent phosphoglycerate mutase (AlkP superfamily)